MSLPIFFSSLPDADAMAAQLPLPKYKAGTNDLRLQWVVAASLRINSSRRWQGRKFDPSQLLEFPRVRESSEWFMLTRLIAQGATIPAYVYAAVWDWDAVNGVAVVPQAVQLATLYEANSIAGGTRDRITSAVLAGLTMQQTGSMIEQYRQDSTGLAPLCSEAELLVGQYTIQTGDYL